MTTTGDFWKGAAVNVFRITPEIYQGAYPNDDAARHLRECGVSAILNVSGGTEDSLAGFTSLSVPFPDGQAIPHHDIERSVHFIDQALSAGEKVFVHCVAGQNRSPTIVWLYLNYSGMTAEQATAVFEGKTLDGVPGHPKLAGAAQVAWVKGLRSAR